ncbi:acyl-CoA desaturase [Streptomyces sp. G44]|uniref:fatty acid desaturase family protein n=1 Tax=Streptomyces sp. G44 TaxID=2807632 RepID=UPI001EF7770D|nr:acyl-CoA desaturase [Streptomyces sp. G44]
MSMAAIGASWWCLCLAPPAALWSVRCAFVGHDAGHRQISPKATISRTIGLVHLPLAAGVSWHGWNHRHNRHHAHTNDPRRDPNITDGPLAWTPAQAASRNRVGRWAAKHQALLFYPAMVLDAALIRTTSLKRLARASRQEQLLEGGLLTLHTVGYLCGLMVLLGPVRALAFAVVHQGLLGLHLGCSFAPNHKGMPAVDGGPRDFLHHQVLTSRNVRGTPLNHWLLGGLNYQIEHHLFPSMPRPHLKRAQPLVRRHCHAMGIPYTETGLFESLRIARLHMNDAPEPFTPPLRPQPRQP